MLRRCPSCDSCSDEDIEVGGGRHEGRSDSLTSLAPCCGTACQQHPYTIRIQELAQQFDQACLRTYTSPEGREM
jgi:hypothetical protein